MRSTPLHAAAFVLLAGISCAKREPASARTERVWVVVDENTIATKDTSEIIEAAWFKANIYGSYKEYESSLAEFSQGQRMLVAVSWYVSEVKNGGHNQFYSNSTGVVWEDAQKGFAAIGVPEAAAIIAESAKRMGGRPSFDRDERNRVLDQQEPSFRDLDTRFFNLNVDIDAKMTEYARVHPKDFVFEGEIERWVR